MTKVRAQISPQGTELVVSAYCLKTDSWHDFESFLSDAKKMDAAGELRKRNRFLRAGLYSLFSHFDAFVEEVCESQKLCESSHDIPLYKKSLAIRDCLKTMGHSLPPLDFRFGKGLRDVTAHPTSMPSALRGLERENHIALLYETLSLQMLEELGKQIGDWCDAVSQITQHPRFSNTKQAVTRIAEKLGKVGRLKKI